MYQSHRLFLSENLQIIKKKLQFKPSRQSRFEQRCDTASEKDHLDIKLKVCTHCLCASIGLTVVSLSHTFQRLTRSLPGEQRDTVLQAYISNDLLERYSAEQVGPPPGIFQNKIIF